MAETIDFYFDFTSPYGYIASQVIDEIAARHDCATRWHAFMVTAAYKQFNATNPLTHAAKEKYFRLDIPRTAAHFGVPFRFPATWPENLVAAGRAFSWIEDRDPDAAKRFAKAVFRQAYIDGVDVTGIEFCCELAAGMGVARDEMKAALTSPEVKETLRKAVEAAVAKGVFGSPYIVVDGEPFWGADRLAQVEEWLVTGGW
mgnify:CR=1 FL=1